jgi:hypothetical protein
MTSTDLFRQRAHECCRLAAAARNTHDKAFWLGLAEFWEAARQRYLTRVLAGEARASICYPSRDDPAARLSHVQGLTGRLNSHAPPRRREGALLDSAIQHGPFPGKHGAG